jgi:hypothetical protein
MGGKVRMDYVLVLGALLAIGDSAELKLRGYWFGFGTRRQMKLQRRWPT